ncbi:imidazoleglycerol-phosphate dehydratase HisB [candidate division KSB1 bacterium]|nr:imidazoleglycerol-phosphate dehydratase HisB [candidate division KSB1 bacterium]NIR71014.1 imidazoleglycerol-phosphate dehydratase HisB [candidate division KSB1 bacterium]NIS26099.1 imidazoleglycerol-phosphate dehydratase HisB [candidate division KSB1 bacterium]NIT72893.1 imidazoleglycerol-phosphate dehydratase HisB [candidate division KSB1 bacterium]NIU26738.1 imidazoleglycerol-phosphate dehydratase HisB [candidate division KSB1 bacterium]
MTATRIERKTKETDIAVQFEIFGKGEYSLDTGVGFFDHMLELFAFHGGFDLTVKCKGDLKVDAHHTVEDTGIVLGQAFKKQLPKDKRIVRYSAAHVPMDETLVRAVVDISGRAYLVFDAEFELTKVGEFETELVNEFFRAFVNHAQLNLHLTVLYGKNTHHRIEALFKATAVALRQAIQIEPTLSGPASSKGALME